MADFSIAGEGSLDLAVARKILLSQGHTVFAEFDKGGKDRLDRSLPGYQNASRYSPWFVLRDLDNHNCLVSLLNQISPDRLDFHQFFLRVCVRSVESWILADARGFAQFFGLPIAKVTLNPDDLVNPKNSLVNFVSASRHKSLREGVVPRVGSGRKVGPEYNAVLTDFIQGVWSIERAVLASASLRRAVSKVIEFPTV